MKWNKPETAPRDGTLFIYTNNLSPDPKKSMTSQCVWRDADEDQSECFYDRDTGDEADIAGWIPRPTELEQ